MDLTRRETVGQLMMIGFWGTAVTSELIDWIQEYRPGGVILFSRNLVDPEQVARLTNALQAAASGPPLFIA
ncbi:MAG: beta-N-acetylhexosaminidase, partial [Nitrospirota bacterium]|nr:beta-N-acetylhexosaminidase [Nitrospirota bacterium]